MDIPVTLLTVFMAYVAVKFVNEVFEKLGATDAGLPSLLKVPLALAAGIGAVCLMASTDFANQQEFFGRTLDTLNGGSQIVAGIAVGAGAVGFDTGFKTLRQVGQNQPDA